MGTTPVVDEVDPTARDVGVDGADTRRGAVGGVDPHPLRFSAGDEREEPALDRLERLEDLVVARAVDRSWAQNHDRDVALGGEDDLLGGELAAPVGRDRLLLVGRDRLAVHRRPARLQARDEHEALEASTPRRLHEVGGSPDVDGEELVGRTCLDEAGHVHHGVDPVDRLADTPNLLDAALEELQVGQALEVTPTRGLAHEGTHLISPVGEELGDVPPEETARSGDKDFHGSLSWRR